MRPRRPIIPTSSSAVPIWAEGLSEPPRVTAVALVLPSDHPESGELRAAYDPFAAVHVAEIAFAISNSPRWSQLTNMRRP